MNESLKISLKKVLREQVAAVLLASIVAIGGLFVNPEVVKPLIEQYAPALPALVTAQIISGLARLIVDQARHRNK